RSPTRSSRTGTCGCRSRTPASSPRARPTSRATSRRRPPSSSPACATPRTTATGRATSTGCRASASTATSRSGRPRTTPADRGDRAGVRVDRAPARRRPTPTGEGPVAAEQTVTWRPGAVELDLTYGPEAPPAVTRLGVPGEDTRPTEPVAIPVAEIHRHAEGATAAGRESGEEG